MKIVSSLKSIFSKKDLSNKKIAVLLKGKEDYWEQIERGVLAGLNGFNLKCDIFWSDSEKDIQGRVLKLISIIENGYDGVILPLSHQLIEILEHATNNGIKVIAVDSPMESSSFTSTISTDNFKAGSEIGHLIAKYMDKEGLVACMNISDNTVSVTERIHGFYNTIKDFYPKIDMTQTIQHYGEIDYAYDLIETVLYKNPTLKAIFAANYHGTIGAAKCLKDLNRTDVLLFGFDSTPEIISFYKEGLLKTLTVQYPYEMGFQSAKQMISSLQGNSVKKFIDTGTYSITPENINALESQTILNNPHNHLH